MRRFYFSIIAVVLGAIFAIGWGFDLLVGETQPEHSSEVTIYRQAIDGMALQLARLPQEKLPEAAGLLSQDFNLLISLVDSQSVALPHSLAQQLSEAGGLYLVSEQESYLLKRIPHHAGYLLHLRLPVLAEQADYSTDLMLTIMLYIGVSLIIVLWTFPLTRRLHLLNTMSAKFGGGDLSARMPPSRFSYIKLLENSFNAMADRIETLLLDNKILARSLSHDIRTPVACLRFGIEAAMSTTSVEKKDKYLTRMDSEVTRMEEMTNAFLEYAGMERQMGSVKLQSVDLVHWLSTLCKDFEELAAQQQVTIDIDIQLSSLACEIDNQWFYRALQNLLSNAIDYADKQVSCILKVTEHDIVIHVDDDGMGIPEQEQKSVFEPFIRLDVDRSRESGHFGLGLAITTKIMDWHQGSVMASNHSSLGGARLSLRLKR
jgi:signal transduction histidine kinase